MKLGIVGLPNVGKSTLFNAITKAGAQSANYPFTTIDPNIGVVNVPDKRLDVLTEMSKSKKTIPAVIEFYDIAGLVRGASKGEGLGNKFLENIREVDAIVEVIRCFEDDNVIHVDGSVDPTRDIETINLELIFSDLELVEKRLGKLEKTARADKSLRPEYELMKRVADTLSNGQSIRVLDLSKEEKAILKPYNLLTIKPIIYVANVDEDDIQGENECKKYVDEIRDYAKAEEAEIVVVSAAIESELSTLDEEDKKEMLDALGLEESGLDKLIKSSYNLLGLISFLTTGEDETRAWTVRKGATAPEAAGKIHTDIERGFIKANTISFDELVEYGSVQEARAHGAIRQEGKDYIMQDGDVVHFMFNV